MEEGRIQVEEDRKVQEYALDSTIEYNWTEFVDDSLKRILADTIITINGGIVII